MVSHVDGRLRGSLEQPPEFAELAEFVCKSIAISGQQEMTRGEIVDSYEPRSLAVWEYDVPNGYGEGSDLRIALSAHYGEWGGLGDDEDVAKKIEAIKMTLGLAEPGVGEDVSVELTAQDFEFSRNRERDVELVRMVGRVLQLSTEEPTDEDLMPLTDVRIDMYREKIQKLYEDESRAAAARDAAERAKAAALAAVPPKKDSFAQPDFEEEDTPVTPPIALDPDVEENHRVTAFAAMTTVDKPKMQEAELVADVVVENNGYSVEKFIDDNDARELSSRQRSLMIDLCLVIDSAKIRSYRRGYRRDPNTSRIITPYMVRTALEALPAGPKARDIEIFLTPEAKKATAALHPDWFDDDVSLPAGYPTLFWLEEVGDRVVVDTNSQTIANFPADRFRSTEDLLYLMNAVRSEVLDQLNEIFDWTPRSAERFSEAVRAMGLPKAKKTGRH